MEAKSEVRVIGEPGEVGVPQGVQAETGTTTPCHPSPTDFFQHKDITISKVKHISWG